MKFHILPGDIPLQLPIGGLEFMIAVFHGLLVLTWIIHILFINVLIGASFASVYFNRRGYLEKNNVFDRVGYLLTTPVTISENMGALWGVAPLLIISILFTPLFYSASLMNSPQWIHIIYGNIVAFLISYVYKYSWHYLEDRKPLHITIGMIAVAIFYTLPFVFMTNVQTYMTPTRWTYDATFWSNMFRADVFLRLGHFFGACFAVTGIFMTIYGYYKKQSTDTLDSDAGSVLIKTGKAWFLVPTVLNFALGPLVLFSFPAYGIEKFFNNGWFILIIISVALALWMIKKITKNFKSDEITKSEVWTLAIIMLVIVTLMATLRHGMRLSLTSDFMKQSKDKTAQFEKDSEKAFKEAEEAIKNPPAQVVYNGDPNTLPGHKFAEDAGCLGCHAVDKVLVGPSIQEIYTLYKDNPDGIVKWAKKPGKKRANFPQMPNMDFVPEEQLKEIAKYYLEVGKK